MDKWAIIGYIVLALVATGVLLNIKDIARYIRITRM
jgi:hypothetical protein